MVLTKIPGGLIADSSITSTDIQDSTITNAKMAVDPSNASNLSSGSVPAAQLDNVDLTAQKGDIALLAFKTQANGNLARYNLVDQSVDSFEDATGINASASTGEYRDSSGKYYSGTVKATSGGTETSYTSGPTTYKVHTFLSSGSFIVGGTGNVDYLVVGGGGGGAGGSAGAGGGGAGGFRTGTAFSLSPATYSITVGGGGAAGGGGDNDKGDDGGDSIFSTITSTGGGGGSGGEAIPGHPGPAVPGSTGGSGGGGRYGGAGGAGNTPSTSPSQGNPGGGSTQSGNRGAGGGGGASATGSAGDATNGGNGGAGTANAFRTGSNVTYAGGGGGGATPGGSGGTGGAGGGGNGAAGSTSGMTAGGTNTGGGGGSNGTPGPSAAPGAAGGSGIVVIRYVDGTFPSAAVGNMTLISNSTTAEAAPTKADVVLTYTNGAGTATLNTDLIASVSRDNGTTYTAVTLASQGTTGGETIVSANNVDISGQPAGTSMVWKVATANQSGSKDTRIHGVSLGWA